MIDVAVEQLVALPDVPSLLPPNRRGKGVHLSAVYRWIQHGLRGVRLESVQLAGRRVTSKEALGRFFTALSERAGLNQLGADLSVHSNLSRKREHDFAKSECEQAGW